MLKLEELPYPTLIELRFAYGAEGADDEDLDPTIAQQSPKEAFTRYCEQEGIIGYADKLWRLMKELNRAAEVAHLSTWGQYDQ